MRLPGRQQKVVEEALAAFTHATGVPATVVARKPRTTEGDRPDAVIELKGPGEPLQFFADIAAVDRAIMLAWKRHSQSGEN